MKILVKDQCLKTGTNKQQYCIKVALPVWGSFVIYKIEQQSVEKEMSSLDRWKTKPNVMVAALGIPNIVQVMQAPEVPNLDKTPKQTS